MRILVFFEVAMILAAHPEEVDSANHLRRFVRGSGVAAAGLILGGALTLVTGVVFARWLNPAEFGTYSLALAAIALLGGLGAAGMDTAMARFVSFYSGTGARQLVIPVIRFGLRWALLLSVCLGALASFLLWSANVLPLKLSPLRPLTLYVTATIPFLAALLVLQQGILGLGGIRARMLVEKALQPVLRLVLPFVLVFLVKDRLRAAVAGVLLATIGTVFIAGIVLKALVAQFPSGGKPTAGEVREWSGYALPFALQSLQQFVSSGLGIDIFLIGVLASLSDSGVYAAAYRLTLLLMLARSAMDYAFGPRVSALFGKGDLHSIDVIYKASSSIGLALTLPLSVIFVLFSRPLMTVLFGDSYAVGAPALAWLVCGCVVDSGTGCNTTLLSMVGRSWLVLTNGIIGGVLTALLCLLLIPRFGISGAAFAVSAARVSVNGLATIELWKLQHIQPFAKDNWRLVLPAGCTILLGLFLKTHGFVRLQQGLSTLFFATAVLLAVYVVGFRVAGLKWFRLV